MKYSKELHDRLRERTQITNIEACALLDEIERLTAELANAKRYIEALENEPVRSQSVIRRLRLQTGVEEELE